MAVEIVGIFDATVKDHGLNATKNGAPYLWMLFECTKEITKDGGRKAVAPFSVEGRFWLSSKKAVEFTLKQINGAFEIGLNFKQLDMMNAGTLRGKPCEVSLEDKQLDNGKVKRQVSFVNKVGNSTDHQNSHSGKIGVDYVMKYVKSQMTNNGVPPEAGNGGVPGAGEGDDDLPF